MSLNMVPFASTQQSDAAKFNDMTKESGIDKDCTHSNGSQASLQSGPPMWANDTCMSLSSMAVQGSPLRMSIQKVNFSLKYVSAPLSFTGFYVPNHLLQ